MCVWGGGVYGRVQGEERMENKPGVLTKMEFPS